MNKQRRRLVQAGLAGTAVIMAAGVTSASSATELRQSSAKPMNVLMLGGTGFIGPHMVRKALRRGHTVTLFNRGKTNNKLFPDLEVLIGDRDGELDALKGRMWDAVIDNSGYVPRHVRESTRLLSDSTSQYLFISSISVYKDYANPNNEDSALATMPDKTVEEVTGDTYGPMKALCEQEAAKVLKDKLTVLRPTYIAGPGDKTDRFTYWPVRVARGGDMLVPGTAKDKIQIIDVRDLANFVNDALQQHITGTYNTVIPAGSYSMGDLLIDCEAITAGKINPVWMDMRFIEAHELSEGVQLPIWSPSSGECRSAALVSGERAFQRGLRTRPPKETVRDTMQWWHTLPRKRRDALRAGLSAERESELLAEMVSK